MKKYNFKFDLRKRVLSIMLFGREYPIKQDEAFLGITFDVEAWRFYFLFWGISIPTIAVKTIFVCLIIYKIFG